MSFELDLSEQQLTGIILSKEDFGADPDQHPLEEAIEHVLELALWDASTLPADTVECAFIELDSMDVPVTIDVLGALMKAVFGSPIDARENHYDLTPHMLEILYPGVTGKLLSWYIAA
jgi:hypothetical protein